MAEEEALLLVGFGVHGDQGASRSEQNNVLALLLGPPDVETHVGLVANDVLEFHYWISIELVRSGEIVAGELAASVFVGSAGADGEGSLL